MKLIILRERFKHQLTEIYGENETLSFFNLLIERHLGLRRIDIALKPNLEIDENQVKQFEAAITRLKNQEPIQYIIGEAEFYNLTFKVNPNVLIPRPETEELVDWVVNDYKNRKEKITILDIGTGSGCIAISLAYSLKNSKVEAWDISSEALKLAKKNAELNKVSVEFRKRDILKIPQSDGFDIIVSNPPYVRKLERERMKNNVLKHEPHLALFVDDNNPLIFYKAILDFAVDNLNENGTIYLEINEYLSKEMLQLFQEYEYKEVDLKKDLFGKARMLKAKKQ